MKLGFEEQQTPYVSQSQNARVLTERWVGDWIFCPNCGHRTINRYPNNAPVADFYCASCREEYELKSQKKGFGARVLDGAYRTMCQRLKADNNPNLFLLAYDMPNREVTDFLVIPKQFFVPEIIEERKPLAPTARRAGWIGCNILLSQIPQSGKIFFVRNKILCPPDEVRAQWQKTLFLRDQQLEARGWLVEVMRCVEKIGRREFNLSDVYAFESELSEIYPNNRFVKPKIRQQLQVLRDTGYLEFVGRGSYRLT